MMADATNYFVCTLGHAAAINLENRHDFSTVSDFLERQNRVVPADPAVGFPIPSEKHGSRDQWDFRVLSMFYGHRHIYFTANRYSVL